MIEVFVGRIECVINFEGTARLGKVTVHVYVTKEKPRVTGSGQLLPVDSVSAREGVPSYSGKTVAIHTNVSVAKAIHTRTVVASTFDALCSAVVDTLAVDCRYGA